MLVTSVSSFGALTAEMTTQLRKFVSDIKCVNFSTLEVLGGGSVASVLGKLF